MADTISVVEDIYDLDSPFNDWAMRVGESVMTVSPDFTDHALVWWYHRPPGQLPVIQKGSIGDATRIERFVSRVPENLDARSIRAFYTELQYETFTQRLRTVGYTEDEATALEHAVFPLGLTEMVCLCAGSPDVTGIGVVASLDEHCSVPSSRRRRWLRVAGHLSSAYRLRKWLGSRPLSLEDGEAVLEADGTLADAKSDGAASLRDELRAACRAIDGARTQRRRKKDPDECLQAWRALVSGRWSLVETIDSDSRRFYVAVENAPASRPASGLTQRERQIAEYVGQGHSDKFIGYLLGLSEKTVSVHLIRALKKLRLRSRIELISLIQSLDIKMND